ncbi:MltR family transcriptional regulator [Paenibacillus pabuli]|uniref:MltR family transcriptional regulator n=1 Tax=Paenibacillus pabuli TaxID=1472 RepID=UPI001FFF6F73|nr:MltR family transcriptional regulator [Paenibacillus pabuli]UPK45469.1 hypothetical protein KET34_08400 [Paenibacillus pabuli]
MKENEFSFFLKEKLEESFLEKGVDPKDLFTDISSLRIALNGESDRGCALLAIAFLDNILKELLRKFLVDDSSVFNNLFAGSGGLSSFSSRIELAYLLGLISPMQRRDLNLLRKIRNDFAHSMDIIDFENQTISNRINELYHLYSGQESSTRTKYIRVIFSIAGLIQGGILRSESRQKKENLDLKSPQVQKMIEDAEKAKVEFLEMHNREQE